MSARVTTFDTAHFIAPSNIDIIDVTSKRSGRLRAC